MANSQISIIIPKVAEGSRELVAIPRKEYEGFLKFYNIRRIKKAKQDGKLSKGLQEALDDVKAGRISKGFDNVDEMMKELLS